jgi:hypothetical protein
VKLAEHPYARALRHLGSAIRSPRGWINHLSRRVRSEIGSSWSRVTDARNDIADRLYARADEIDADKVTTVRTEPEES